MLKHFVFKRYERTLYSILFGNLSLATSKSFFMQTVFLRNIFLSYKRQVEAE